MTGTVALWSPKVLRAGMGAHFGLELVEGADTAVLDGLAVPLVAAVPRAATVLWDAPLPWPCAWLLGHEGRGLEPALLARCTLQVAIPQAGRQESLNVAAAGAICLYESVRQHRLAQPLRRGQ
jgi:TrmH family RNA methyltransferase